MKPLCWLLHTAQGAVCMWAAGLVIGVVLGGCVGRVYTERQYRDVATCSACDGRGVVTTAEATDGR